MFSAPERPFGWTSRYHVTVGTEGRTAGPADSEGINPSISRKRVRVHRRTHADQVPVAEGAVHAAHRRPDLVRSRRDGGGGGALACVRAGPRVGNDVFLRGPRIPAQGVVRPARSVL